MSGNGVSERTGVARGGIYPAGRPARRSARKTRRDAGAVDLLTGGAAQNPQRGAGLKASAVFYRNRRLVFRIGVAVLQKPLIRPAF